MAAAPLAAVNLRVVTAPVLLPNAVAVLPFENLSPNAEDAYFAFGVAEGVLHRLAQNRNVALIARTSSFAAAAKPADARDVGRALNARYIVEGSVQRANDQLRVTAQLIDASTGEHRWSLRFDRTVDDIFAVEDEIARSIAEALEVSVLSQNHPTRISGRRLSRVPQRARAHRQAHDRRLGARDGAFLACDRDCARVCSGLRRTGRSADDPRVPAERQPRGGIPGTPGLPKRDPARCLSRCGSAARQSVALDDSLGEAYVLRADLEAIRQDVDAAEADYRKGLALDPSNGTAHEHFATFLGTQGRIEEAHAEIDRAVLVDPLSARNVYRKGFTYVYSEETGIFGEQSEMYFLKALELAPDYHPALLHIGAIRWHQGKFAEAIRFGEQVAIDPRSDWLRACSIEFYLELGEVDAARNVLSSAPGPVRPIEWLAVCWYELQPERAADLLRAEPDGRGLYDHDVEAYVFRDAALANGDLARGREDLLTLPSKRNMPVEEDPFRLVTLAQVNLALGDRHEAERLARLTLDFKDGLARSSTQYRLAYPMAAALTVLEQTEAALDLLEESFAHGYRKRWWYAFDRDVAFEPLRSNPRFQVLTTEARAHADAEHRLLQQMRERGEVPKRDDKVAATGGC
jgi:TolB-like protein/Tfp pilus assembly protein PilF